MKPKSFAVVALGAVLLGISCKKDDETIFHENQKAAGEFNSAVIVEWYALIKTLTAETPGYTPPVAARAFGYTGVALYEAIVPGIPDQVSFSGKLNDLEITTVLDENKRYHWPAVANAVLAKMTSYFYASASDERLVAIATLEARYHDQFVSDVGEEVYSNSQALAADVATKILEWSTSDGGKDGNQHNFPTDYVPPTGPGLWVPTPPGYLTALQPYWGNNRPFLTSDIDDTQPVIPPSYSEEVDSPFYLRAMEVYSTVNNLTPEQEVIARFWSDDPVTTATPPGHSISILNQLIKENDLPLDEAVTAFAKLGIGISDAFISCWKCKYEYNYMRPVTYIQAHIDPDWMPLLTTPPFPEYTSGHSVQSGALAEIMTDIFGDNYSFTDRTHESRSDITGTPRHFDSFYDLAEEAAISRLYGGIHYKEAIELGLEQGYLIGRNINALGLKK